MKLKTKFQDEDFELGEVVDAVVCTGSGKIELTARPKSGGIIRTYYESLAELIEDWEDAPEDKPKEYWYISPLDADIVKEENKGDNVDEFNEEIGNHFETEEEGEQAIEKLKALKRLEEKGFRFDGYEIVYGDKGNLCGQLFYKAGDYWKKDVEEELDLLFSGEDE